MVGCEPDMLRVGTDAGDNESAVTRIRVDPGDVGLEGTGSDAVGIHRSRRLET